jgi:hypothetical protein
VAWKPSREKHRHALVRMCWRRFSRVFSLNRGMRSALHSGCVGGDVVELQRERDRCVHPHQDGDVRDPVMTEDLDRAVVEALGIYRPAARAVASS